MARRRRRTIRGEIHSAFERAAIEWKKVAVSAIERRLTNDSRIGKGADVAADPRIDLALRHRILRSALLAREAEILVAAVHGIPRSALGGALGIGENTLKTHVNRLMRKLGTQTLDQAVIEILRSALGVTVPTEAAKPAPRATTANNSGVGAVADARHFEDADADLRGIGRRVGAEKWAERALAYLAKWNGKTRLVERIAIAATLPQPFRVVDLARTAGISSQRARAILRAGERRGFVTAEDARWRVVR